MIVIQFELYSTHSRKVLGTVARRWPVIPRVGEHVVVGPISGTVTQVFYADKGERMSVVVRVRP